MKQPRNKDGTFGTVYSYKLEEVISTLLKHNTEQQVVVNLMREFEVSEITAKRWIAKAREGGEVNG